MYRCVLLLTNFSVIWVNDDNLRELNELKFKGSLFIEDAVCI